MHSTRPASLALALLSLAALGLAARPAQAQTTINFDNVTAPAFFGAVTPGSAQGPTLVFPTITFTGGVILNDSSFNSKATTKPNLYATSDFATLADRSKLPGVITATFASPGLYNGIVLDVANGNGAGNFTLTAFNAGNTVVASETLALNGFLSPTMADGQFSLTGSGIDHFTVTSDQLTGSKDFAIDTVRLSAPAPAVPEPSPALAFAVAALGLGGLMVAAKRKKTNVKNVKSAA